MGLLLEETIYHLLCVHQAVVALPCHVITFLFSLVFLQVRSLRDDFTGQVRVLKDKLEQSASENEQLKSDHADLIVDRRQSLHKLRMDYEHASRQLDESKYQREKALTDANEAKIALEQATGELDGLRPQKEQLEAELKKCRSKCEQLGQDLAQVKGKCEDLTGEYCQRIEALELSQTHAQKERERKEEELK